MRSREILVPSISLCPSEILMTSMKEHQGFFSVRGKKTGRLAPHFIAVANNQLKDMSLIRAGNERVLSARLADAKFFFDEDRKTRLEGRRQEARGRHLPPKARHDGAKTGAREEVGWVHRDTVRSKKMWCESATELPPL